MAQTQYKSIDLRGYLDLNKNELRNARIHNLGSDPGTPVEGQALWRTDTHRLRLYNGTAFTDAITGDFLTTKGDIITASAANTPVRKAAGANGTFLQAQSGQADGLLWTTIADADIPATLTRDTEVFLLSAYTTKGDIGIATGGSTVARHGVGANGTFLVANSANGDGWENRAIVAADIQEKIATADLTDWPRVAALDLNSQKITNLLDGTAAQDAATFGQLNAILEGKIGKDPVEVASTVNIAALSGLTAIDGYTPVAGDRILLKDQTTTSQNGVYVAAAGAWSRAADMSAAAEFKNGTVLVLNGTVGKGKIFTESNTVTTVGTDAVAFVQTSITGATYTADETTLTLGGSVFSIKAGGVLNAQIGAGAAIVYSKLSLGNSIVNADIAAAAAIAYSKLNLATSIVNADIAGAAAIAYSKLNLTGLVVNADIAAAAAIAYSKLNLATSIVNGDINAGAAIAYSKLNLTGAILAADIAAAAGIPYSKLDSTLIRKYVVSLTGGATTEVLTHNLNTRDIASVVLINNGTPWDMVEVEWAATSVNTVTLSSPVNLPASYRAVVSA